MTSPPRSGTAERAPWALVVPAVLAAALAFLPLGYLVVRTVAAEHSLVETLASAHTLGLFGRTLALCAAVVATTVTIATGVAWLVARTDLPGRSAWALANALPLAIPSYVAAFSLVAFLGPRGVVQRWLSPLGVSTLPDWVYGFSGALLALALFTYPYVFLPVLAGFRQLDPAVEESARSMGAGPWKTFFRIVLPQLRAPVAAGGLLVALYTLSDFGAVSIARYPTFTLSIYNAYRILFDRSVAASLALVLVLTTLGVIGLHAWMGRNDRPVRERPFRRSTRVALGRWKSPVLFALTLLAVVNLGVPLATIGLWAWRAFEAGNPLGTAGASAWNSVLASGCAALVATTLAVPMAVWRVRFPGAPSRWAGRVSQAGYALPGLVVALALVFFTTRHAMVLYQSLALLVVAYVVRFFPQALASDEAAVAAVSPRFEEASRTLGQTSLRTWRKVTVPLVRPGVAAGAGLVFLTAMKELPATLILRPTGFDTLATRIWSATAEGLYSQAALPALLLLLVSGPAVYWLVVRPALVRDQT